MIIPAQQLSADTLTNILEEFITRDGTDYGDIELSLSNKVERLRPQVLAGEVLVVFDERLQNVQLIAKEDYREATS